MAATGMVLRSTKPLGLMKKEEAESASRRHLDNPMSLGIRMEANGPPAPPLLTSGPRLPLPENEALSFFKTSRTSCSPVVSIWAAVTVSTGAGPTVSAVGMYEPVTTVGFKRVGAFVSSWPFTVQMARDKLNSPRPEYVFRALSLAVPSLARGVFIVGFWWSDRASSARRRLVRVCPLPGKIG